MVTHFQRFIRAKRESYRGFEDPCAAGALARLWIGISPELGAVEHQVFGAAVCARSLGAALGVVHIDPETCATAGAVGVDDAAGRIAFTVAS